MMKKRDQQGFTLMEMLIVVTIIGILSAIVIPRFITSSSQAKASAYEAERQLINSQLELYYFINDAYPDEMTNEAWGTSDSDGNGTIDYMEYFPEGVPEKSVYGTAWSITNGRVTATTPEK